MRRLNRVVRVLSRFSRVWLCDPMDRSLPGSSVHGIFQAQTLEWVVMCPPAGCPPDLGIEPASHVSCIGRQVLYHQRHPGDSPDVAPDGQISLSSFRDVCYGVSLWWIPLINTEVHQAITPGAAPRPGGSTISFLPSLIALQDLGCRLASGKFRFPGAGWKKGLLPQGPGSSNISMARELNKQIFSLHPRPAKSETGVGVAIWVLTAELQAMLIHTQAWEPRTGWCLKPLQTVKFHDDAQMGEENLQECYNFLSSISVRVTWKVFSKSALASGDIRLLGLTASFWNNHAVLWLWGRLPAASELRLDILGWDWGYTAFSCDQTWHTLPA